MFADVAHVVSNGQKCPIETEVYGVKSHSQSLNVNGPFNIVHTDLILHAKSNDFFDAYDHPTCIHRMKTYHSLVPATSPKFVRVCGYLTDFI